MIKVNVAGFLTDFTGGRNQIAIDGSPASVGQALSELWKLHPGLRDRVVNEQGQLRQHVNVFLDSENIRRKQLLETEVSEGSELTILPSVSGGSEQKAESRRSRQAQAAVGRGQWTVNQED